MRTDFETIRTGRPLFQQLGLAHLAGTNLMLHGPPGVGKSEHAAEYCRGAGLGHRVVNLAMFEATDLTGLPYIRRGRTWHASPGFWPGASEAPGLIVLEEPNRADPSTLAPTYDLLTSRRLGDYQLPEGWTFVGCMNDGGHVYPLDPALFDRFAHVTVVPDRTAFLEYAARHEMHPAVIEFVRNLPDSEFGIDPSPRAWHYASRVLAQATATAGVDEAALRVALTSWLGREIGVRFLVSLGKERAGIGGQEVIVAYPSYQALVRGWVQNGRADHLLPTLKAVEKALRSHGPTAPDSATRRHILAFAGDLQGDLRERALAMVRAHTSGDGR